MPCSDDLWRCASGGDDSCKSITFELGQAFFVTCRHVGECRGTLPREHCNAAEQTFLYIVDSWGQRRKCDWRIAADCRDYRRPCAIKRYRDKVKIIFSFEKFTAEVCRRASSRLRVAKFPRISFDYLYELIKGVHWEVRIYEH